DRGGRAGIAGGGDDVSGLRILFYENAGKAVSGCGWVHGVNFKGRDHFADALAVDKGTFFSHFHNDVFTAGTLMTNLAGGYTALLVFREDGHKSFCLRLVWREDGDALELFDRVILRRNCVQTGDHAAFLCQCEGAQVALKWNLQL